MKRLLVVLSVVFLFLLTSCDYIAPGAEKSKTEKKQYELLKEEAGLLEEQNRLLRIQNAHLNRIAEALEKGVEYQERGGSW